MGNKTKNGDFQKGRGKTNEKNHTIKFIAKL